jgi:hypothetical protein
MQALDHHSFAAVAAALSSTLDDDDDAPAHINFPLIRPDSGGAVVAYLSGNELRISYSGPRPFNTGELGGLCAAVGEYLAAAVKARVPVETLRLEAAFVDPTEDDDEGDDDGESWGDEQ